VDDLVVLQREEHGEYDGDGDDGVPLWDLVSRFQGIKTLNRLTVQMPSDRRFESGAIVELLEI
jgi:hypothetical protein